MEPMLRSLELGGGGGGGGEGGGGPWAAATCWPFIIPKSSEKVSVIFHLVDFNDTMQLGKHGGSPQCVAAA